MRIAPVTAVESVFSSMEGGFDDERIIVTSRGIVLEERKENVEGYPFERRRSDEKGGQC